MSFIRTFVYQSLCILLKPTYTLTSFLGFNFFSTSDLRRLNKNGLKTACKRDTN